jgi:uncharacterized protein YggT (Ycf19 family)
VAHYRASVTNNACRELTAAALRSLVFYRFSIRHFLLSSSQQSNTHTPLPRFLGTLITPSINPFKERFLFPE